MLADAALGLALRWAGEPYRARERFRQGLDLARRVGDSEALFTLVSGYMGSIWTPEGVDEAVRLVDAMLAAPPAVLRPRTEARFLFTASPILLAYGRREQVEAMWRRTEALAASSRDVNVLLYPLYGRACGHLLDGHMEQALQMGASFLSHAEEFGIAEFGQVNRAWIQFRPLLLLGRAEEAMELTGVPRWREAGRRVLALAHLGRLQDARADLANVLNWMGSGEEWEAASVAMLVELLEAACLVADAEAASRLLSRLAAATCDFIPDPTDQTCIARHLGAASALLGQPQNALRHFQRAIAACRAVGFRPEASLTRLQLAELLLRHYPEQQSQAVEHLGCAMDEFQEMHMPGALAQAKRLLTVHHTPS